MNSIPLLMKKRNSKRTPTELIYPGKNELLPFLDWLLSEINKLQPEEKLHLLLPQYLSKSEVPQKVCITKARDRSLS